MKFSKVVSQFFLKVKGSRGFTLIELLVVMTIIGILMALVIGVAGPVQQQARVYRTRGEIAAMETALTRFETDNGFVPPVINVGQNGTNYGADPSSANYTTTSKALFLALTGKHYYYSTDPSGTNSGPNYFTTLKSSQVRGSTGNPTTGHTEAGPLSSSISSYAAIADGDYLIDAWGNPFGYYYDSANTTNHSLFNQVTYDLWSTSGETTTDGVAVKRWTANWPN